jgi:hypothetical protein
MREIAYDNGLGDWKVGARVDEARRDRLEPPNEKQIASEGSNLPKLLCIWAPKQVDEASSYIGISSSTP